MGFALGIERVLLALPENEIPDGNPLQVYLIALEEQYIGKVFKMQEILRAGGISCDMGYRVSSVKSQMRSANKAGALNVIIFGEEEEKKDLITLKDMTTGEQKQVTMSDLVEEVTRNQLLEN